MLFILKGSDYEQIRKQASVIIDNLKKRKTKSIYTRITSQTEDENLESILNTNDLFSKKKIVFFDNVFENTKIKTAIENNIKEIIEAKDFFLLLEYNLPQSFLKNREINKNLKKIKIKEINKKETIPPNFFHLSDLLSKQNKKALWVGFCRETKKGDNIDSISKIFSWQLKTMLLTYGCVNAKEAKLKEFVFKKSKEGSKKISKETALKMLFSLQKENFRYIKKIPKSLQIENWILKKVVD